MTHVVGKLKHLHRLKYKLADVSAGKLSTPETWAHDTGIRPMLAMPADTPIGRYADALLTYTALEVLRRCAI